MNLGGGARAASFSYALKREILRRLLRHLIATAEPAGLALCAAAALVLSATTALAIWRATRRIVALDPATTLRAD